MIERRQLLKTIGGTAIFAGFTSVSAIALAAEKITPIWFREPKIAANGYDVVGYFTMSKPVQGSTDHKMMWEGAEWRFSSAENLAAFKASPAKFAPQYGGHCAFAMSKNALAPTDPEAWTVVDGKLYLNFSTNVRMVWSEDVPGNIKKANVNWPTH